MAYYRPTVGKPLTAREEQVFRLVLDGNSLKGVARIVGLSEDTVQGLRTTNRRRLFTPCRR